MSVLRSERRALFLDLSPKRERGVFRKPIACAPGSDRIYEDAIHVRILAITQVPRSPAVRQDRHSVWYRSGDGYHENTRTGLLSEAAQSGRERERVFESPPPKAGLFSNTRTRLLSEATQSGRERERVFEYPPPKAGLFSNTRTRLLSEAPQSGRGRERAPENPPIGRGCSHVTINPGAPLGAGKMISVMRRLQTSSKTAIHLAPLFATGVEPRPRRPRPARKASVWAQ